MKVILTHEQKLAQELVGDVCVDLFRIAAFLSTRLENKEHLDQVLQFLDQSACKIRQLDKILE